MSDRTNPPSDEVMAKVVAKWRGVDVPFVVTISTVGKGIKALVPMGREVVEIVDPRFDTDAALELLWFLDGISAFEILADIRNKQTGWCIRNWDDMPMFIPISGQPFRTAVCWLVVDVMGVEHD
jgi:hypothetical protein